MTRRLLARASLALVAGSAFSLGIWAFCIEPNRLVVNTTRLELPRWPGPPLRVALISDLHVGAPWIDLERVRLVVERTNALEPDLVLLLGDFVGTEMPFLTPVPVATWAAVLGTLRPRLGTFAVLGNHDWWDGGPAIRTGLEAVGIRVLDNESALISHGSAPLALVGVADPMTRTPAPEAAISAVPEGVPMLVFCHSPDVFPQVSPRASITFAGHTHGGQVRLPLVGALVVPSIYGQRYALGHVVEAGRHLFVTTGIGTSTLPVRFGVPPEIALVELHARAVPIASPEPRE